MLEAIGLFVTFALQNKFISSLLLKWSRSSVDRIEVS